MPGATEAFTSVGTTIAVALTVPATFDQAGFSAVGQVYTEIAEVEELPGYGPEASVQTRTPLKTGIVRKRKGSTNMGAMEVTAAMVPGDAGHIKMKAAQEQTTPASVKITYPDGMVEYFTALVTSYKRTPGGADSWAMAAFNLDIDSAIVTVLPA